LTDFSLLLRSIVEASSGRKVVVAFSGGKDSSLVLFLAVQALNKEKVIPVHVDWGPYSYSGVKERVEAFSRNLGLDPVFIPGKYEMEKILKGGPSCNRCTRKAKLGLIRKKFPSDLILTGANQADSWGKRGEPLMNGVFAPLFSLSRNEIKDALGFFGLEVESIGESNSREGCKAKHLLKPLISPAFHGGVVSEANEVLLGFFREKGMEMELANIKIVGPLSENIGLVNVRPFLEAGVKEELQKRLLAVKNLNKVEFVDAPFRLTLVVNPSIYNDLHARESIEEGIIFPSFAFPPKIWWVKSQNKRLLSFHVVSAERLSY
jgi:uncharacterized protein